MTMGNVGSMDGKQVYRLCGIEQPEWFVDPTNNTMFVGREADLFGAQVAFRWIALLDGRPYTRRSDGPYDIYEAAGSTLRVKIG